MATYISIGIFNYSHPAIAETATSSLIKTKSISSVYYLDADSKRHAFPSESVYFSWYENFSGVKTISETELSNYPLSTNVTMRPGTKLIKITTDPSVYAVEPGGVLRKIPSETEASTIYGSTWSTKVVDVSDAFFTNYTMGTPIASSTPPAGTLVKSADTKYFYFDGTNYRQITSAETFRANRFKSENIISLNTVIDSSVIGSSVTTPENVLSDIHAITLASGVNQKTSNYSSNSNTLGTATLGNTNHGGGGGGSTAGGGGGGSVSNGGGGGSIKDHKEPDTIKPIITAFSLASSSNSLTVPVTSLVASDNVAVTGYLLTESSSTPTSIFSQTIPSSYVFSSEGAKTLYAWAIDAAGNISLFSNGTTTISIPVDATATTYILTGPSSGNINSFSTNFSITPNNNYTGTITITPSGTGATGLSPITKTFTNSSLTQTFSILPTVAGPITLTATNNKSLINPINLTYTALTVPGAPSSITATAGNASAVVSFSAPASNGGSAITGYTVSSLPAGGVDANANSTLLTHSITGLTNGTSYTFTVRALNGVGTSLASVSSNAVTPQAPVDTTKPIITAFTIPSSSSALTISISSLTATDNLSVTGYLLTETATAPAAGATGWTASAPTTYTFSAADSKTLYAWAKDAAGNVSLSTSRTVVVTLSTSTGKTYYVSQSTGSDSYTAAQAQNPTTPWKTIAKVNAQTFLPGDSILFKRGDIWNNETITVSSSGNSTAPITYGAYGSGNQPLISGFTTITGWTNEGNGIYSKIISPQSFPNVVAVDGVNTGMGRWPNAGTANGGYLTFESNTGATSITDNQLTSLTSNNWAGAEIVTRTNNWWIDKGKVASQVGNVITYATPIRYDAIPGYGYFIQNDLRTLDQVGEWYYNSTTKKFSMYFGTNTPGYYVVQVSTTDELFSSSAKNYITLDGLSFAGANTSAVRFRATVAANHVTVNNCNIDLSGLDGIYIDGGTSNITISNCNINNSHDHAIYIGVWAGTANTATVSNNNISNIGLMPGMGGANDPDNSMIISCDNSLIENNLISFSGYNGMSIRAQRSNVTIKNNFITDSCKIKDDCAGIYLYTNTYNNHPTNYIQNNIVLNSISNHEGVKTGATVISHGIYLDNNTENTVIANNTVANNAGSGIFLGYQTKNDIITQNTSYNNGHQLWSLRGAGVLNPAFTITDNIFFAKDAAKDLVFIDGSDPTFLGTMNNNYYDRPINDDNVFYIATAPIYPRYKLSEWQTVYNQDLDSRISPVSITDPNNILFDYNATASNKVVPLGSSTYVDVAGATHTGSVTLLPYTSIILIKVIN